MKLRNQDNKGVSSQFCLTQVYIWKLKNEIYKNWNKGNQKNIFFGLEFFRERKKNKNKNQKKMKKRKTNNGTYF